MLIGRTWSAEEVPEIMVPRGAGTVIPHGKIALGRGTRNSVTHNQFSNVTVNADGSSHEENQSWLKKSAMRSMTGCAQ